MKKYSIDITDTIRVSLTAQEVIDLHDRLTQLYNEHYDVIHESKTD